MTAEAEPEGLSHATPEVTRAPDADGGRAQEDASPHWLDDLIALRASILEEANDAVAEMKRDAQKRGAAVPKGYFLF